MPTPLSCQVPTIWPLSLGSGSSLLGFGSQPFLYPGGNKQQCIPLWWDHLLSHELIVSPLPLCGTVLWWNIYPQPQGWGASYLVGMSLSQDPNSLLAFGVALVLSSSYQGTRTCINHKPSNIFEPLSHLTHPYQRIRAHVLSTLGTSCIGISKFH